MVSVNLPTWLISEMDGAMTPREMKIQEPVTVTRGQI